MNKSKTDKILEQLFSLHRFGIKPGLVRTVKLLNYLGNPEKQFSSIHVAGTNGKGSVSSLIASILMESGYKTGLFTSPHILKFDERIKINGNDISDDEIADLCPNIINEGSKYECTFFEISVALALKYFADNNAEFVVIEAGMGGKSDSTNILNPILSVITKIGLDHQEYLGSTILEIADEKAGIIKYKTPVIIQENREELKPIFTNKAQKEKSEICFALEEFKAENIIYNNDLTMKFDISGRNKNYKNIEIPLAGRHQINNAITAITTADSLKQHFIIKKEHIYNGIKNVRKNCGLNGRLELFNENPLIILDVCHNPDGIASLVDTIKEFYGEIKKWNIVFAAMSDKDIFGMLEKLGDISETIYPVQLKIKRAATLETLIELSQNLNFKISGNGNINSIISLILENKEPFIIAGSFYLIEEFLVNWENFKNL